MPALQHLNLPGLVDDRFQHEPCGKTGLGQGGEALQDHDALGDAALAQGLGLAQGGDHETIGPGLHRPGAGQHAMPVGIGLDHGEDLGAARGGPRTTEIVPKRLDIDVGPGRPQRRHS